MNILKRIIELFFPGLKPSPTVIRMMRKHFEFAEFMKKNGYRIRVGDRGGMRWERTEPDEFYEGRPNPWFEYSRIKKKYPYDKDGNWNP